MEKKNKEYVINLLMEKTNKSKSECIIINSILENHFIVGHNNKEKIKNDFMQELNISALEADDLYNICIETIVKNIFK